MDKKSDAFLRNVLKNWVKQQRPPDNGRARLFWDAAHLSRNKIDLSVLFFRPQFKSYPQSSANDWPQTLFSWINENSLQFGVQARLG
ncbi:MAG: hypothetical protein A2136_00820 [Chloroflexi bacterium RBG_16_54_11]|nr:MAG: hypothetical protein A2136_00820 [Chloroflexi bacterium RBG_16_54_11]